MEPLPGHDRGQSLPPSPCWVTGLPQLHPQGGRDLPPHPKAHCTSRHKGTLAGHFPGGHSCLERAVGPTLGQGSHWALGTPSTPLRLPCLLHAPWPQSPEIRLILPQGAKTNQEEQQLSRLKPSALHKLGGDGSHSVQRSYIQVPTINADTDL